MQGKTKSLIQLHAATILFGGSSLFGEIIKLSPLLITFGRMLFALLFFATVLAIKKQDIKIKDRKDFLLINAQGIILALHWLAFFQSIQVSNIAVCLLTFSTYPIFVTFLEPIFFKEKLHKFDIYMALLSFIGISLIIPKFDLSNNILQGACWGIVAGITCAVLTVLNKRYVAKYHPLTITFYSNLTVIITTTPIVLWIQPSVSLYNIGLLALLGIVFTGVTPLLFLSSLRGLKAQLASITGNLEPIYGITLAALFLGQIPNSKTIIGGAIILIATLLSTISHSKRHPEDAVKEEDKMTSVEAATSMLEG